MSNIPNFEITCTNCGSEDCDVYFCDPVEWSEDTIEPTELMIRCDKCGTFYRRFEYSDGYLEVNNEHLK